VTELGSAARALFAAGRRSLQPLGSDRERNLRALSAQLEALVAARQGGASARTSEGAPPVAAPEPTEALR
jgi:hypothetical protein